MSRFILFSLAIFISSNLFAQRTEFDINGHLSFQTFRGSRAEKYSFINKHPVYNFGYVNDQFGKNTAIGYGALFTLQRITKSRIIFGLSAGAELLKNQIKINYIATSSGNIPASGSVNFTSRHINCIPFIGYRFKMKKLMTIDLDGILEFAFPTGPRDGDGKISSNDNSLIVNGYNSSQDINTDFRTGLMVSVNRKCFSLISSYSTSQSNYYSGYTGTNGEAYSNVFRTGLRYIWIGKKK